MCFVLRECFESVLHAKAAATSEGTGSFLFSDVRMPLFSHRFHDTIVSEKTKAAGIGEMDKYEILKKYFGYDSFREGQENLIDALLGGQDALGIMPTGAGKSLCYQVPALMMSGITLVISPLISLMKDQVNALVQQGVSAAYLNRSLTDAQYVKALRNASGGKYKIIYVAPERLESAAFLNMCRAVRIAMVAVDEAHCVSQWGQDFRPGYLTIRKFISQLYLRPVIGAFTATATAEVKQDIIRLLDLNCPVSVTTGFDRPNLYFAVLRPNQKEEKLLELLKERKGKSGIVYCSTRRQVEEVCDMLNTGEISATRYHAGLVDEERVKNQDDFVYDRKQVMVATNAFGMGIDKSNVSFVIHYNMPKNLESYYQEAGRAGRDGSEADCILLYSKRDVMTCRYFIDHIEPNPDLTQEQNEAFLRKEEERLKQMVFYCTTSDCLRRYMLRYFGDSSRTTCGKCSNCLTEFETADVTIEAQKILSCIIRTGQRYGAKMISDVLRGETSEKIMRAGLDTQSTYGIMRNSRAAEIRYIIEKLEEQEYIISVDTKRPILRVTEMCYPVLRGKARVNIRKSRLMKAYEANPALGSVNPELFEALKQLRIQFARKRGVPAFAIFTDATLTDMCRKLPTNEREFLAVSGVGQNKLQKYGKAFLRVIKKYKPNRNGKLPFLITRENLRSFSFSDEPMTLAEIAAGINSLMTDSNRNRLTESDITEILVSLNVLEVTQISGQSYCYPTPKGEKCGVTLERCENSSGELTEAVLFSRAAQEYVMEKLAEVFAADG